MNATPGTIQFGDGGRDIESDNFSALIRQVFDNVAADVAATADDQDLHGATPNGLSLFYTMVSVSEQYRIALRGD
jgi:hypothetical protein